MKEYSLNRIPLMQMGRNGVLSENGLPLFWAGSGIEINVKSQEVWAKLDVDYGWNDIWLCVYVNGRKVSRFMAQKGENWICLIRGFSGTEEKSIEIIKDTQPMGDDKSQKCIIRALGLSDDGTFCQVKPKPMSIEFVGDSITSGEGTVGSPAENDWISAWISVENNYAMQIKRAFNAQVNILSQCGWGVVYSYDGNKDHAMPPYYETVCGFYDAPHQIESGSQGKWDFESNRNDWVIVNLGVNDMSSFGGKPSPEQAKTLEEGMISFLKKIREKNPDAKILWVWNMLPNEDQHLIMEKGMKIYKETTGDEKAWGLKLPSTELEKNDEDKGSRGHPGPLTHKNACIKICEFIGNHN